MYKLALAFVGSFFFFFMSCKRIESFDHKTLNIISPSKIKGYDPIHSGDAYSSKEVSKIYEGLYQYHYLKRPYELIPNLASSLPHVSEDGLTYTISLVKGAYFHDDLCFPNQKGREMKASDVIYSFKRLADPKQQSPGWSLLRDKIEGLDKWRETSTKSNITNYNTSISGLKAIDDYTIQLKLTTPYPQLLYTFAMSFTFIIPHEAVDMYGEEFLNHPVGTGPFVLHKFRPIV